MAELLPNTAPIAAVIDPAVEAADLENSAQVAAQSLGRHVIVIRAASDRDLESAVTAAMQKQVAGLVFTAQPLFVSRHQQLAAIVARYPIPAAYAPADLAASGGLMSYGASIFEMFRRVGNYSGKMRNARGSARPAP